MLHSVHILKNPSNKFSVKWFLRFKRGEKEKKNTAHNEKESLWSKNCFFNPLRIELTNLSFHLLDSDFNPFFIFSLFLCLYVHSLFLSFFSCTLSILKCSLSSTFCSIYVTVCLYVFLYFYSLPRCHGVTRTTRIFSFPLGEFSDASPCLINACTSQWTLLSYVSVCLLKSAIKHEMNYYLPKFWSTDILSTKWCFLWFYGCKVKQNVSIYNFRLGILSYFNSKHKLLFAQQNSFF